MAIRMEWIDVKKELPKIPEGLPEYNRSVKVIAAWGNKPENTAEMSYCEEIVRGKVICRFKWNCKISPWEVLFWMPFPKPPKDI